MDEHLSYELSLLNIDFNNSNMAMQDLLNLVKQYKQQVDIVHTQLTKLDGEYTKLQQSHLYLQTEHHQVQTQFNQLHLQHNKVTNDYQSVQIVLQQAKKQELAVRQDMQFLKSKTSSDVKRKDIEIGKVKDMTIKTMKMNVKKDYTVHFNPNYKKYLNQKPIQNIPDAYQLYIDMLNERNAFLKQEIAYYKALFKGVLFELPSEYESRDPQLIIKELVSRINHTSNEPQMDKSTISKIIAEQNRLLDLATSADFNQVYYVDSAPEDTMNSLLYDKREATQEWKELQVEKNKIQKEHEKLAMERMELRKMVRQEEKNRVQFMMNLVNTPINTPYKNTPPRMQDYSTPIQNKSKSIPFGDIKNRSVFKESKTVDYHQ